MKMPEEILKNLVMVKWNADLTFEQGLSWLKPHAKKLEVIHFVIDALDQTCWKKKEYCHVKKVERWSRLDEWIYKNIFDLTSNKCHEEYAGYLDRYRPLLEAGKIKDIDEYIMNKHYRAQAIKILRHKKSFSKLIWEKPRNGLEYKRRTNLFTKDGRELAFEDMFFILKKDGNKEIIAVGDGGNSLYRQFGTFYTAIFYLLSKEYKIPRHVFRYNRFNKYEYLGRYYRTILPSFFGSNFELDKSLRDEIREKCEPLKEKGSY